MYMVLLLQTMFYKARKNGCQEGAGAVVTRSKTHPWETSVPKSMKIRVRIRVGPD